nr:MAG TPA: Neurohypophysial hormone [Caudoviricetes sp.]
MCLNFIGVEGKNQPTRKCYISHCTRGGFVIIRA